jgi:hypothetical protein
MLKDEIKELTQMFESSQDVRNAVFHSPLLVISAVVRKSLSMPSHKSKEPLRMRKKGGHP